MFTCSICDKVFNKRYDYKRHAKKQCCVSLILEKEKSKENRCDFCLKIFCTPHSLNRHLQNQNLGCYYREKMSQIAEFKN